MKDIRAIFPAPLCKGEPGPDGGHISDVADEGETLGPRGEGCKSLLLGQNLFDKVEADTCETEVEPCYGEHDSGKERMERKRG